MEKYVLDPINPDQAKQCVLKDYQDIQKYTVDLLTKYHSLDSVNHYNLYKENDIIEKI